MPAQRLDQLAAVDVPGNDRVSSRGTALADAVTGVEQEIGLDGLGLRRMAFVAAFDQDGPDLRFEEVELRLGQGGVGGSGSRQESNDDQQDCLPNDHTENLSRAGSRTIP